MVEGVVEGVVVVVVVVVVGMVVVERRSREWRRQRGRGVRAGGTRWYERCSVLGVVAVVERRRRSTQWVTWYSVS